MVEILTEPSGKQVKIPCCLCGILIEPNPSSMCEDCIRQTQSILAEIPNTSSIVYCKWCGRYQTGPTIWQKAALESPELMSICIKKLTGLKGAKIIESRFLYTEPHSKRIKVSLTLQKETENHTILRQTAVFTYVVQIMQCPQCMEEATPRDHWVCNVQLRQNVSHQRTLYWLEQIILTHRAHASCVSLERKDDGIDFHFQEIAQARQFVSFLKTKIPAKTDESSKRITEDVSNGTKEMRYSISVRCPPLCRQDLVVLPQHLVQASGNKTRVALVDRIGKRIKLLDPFTLTVIPVDAQSFWKKEFGAVLSAKDLKRFIVLSVEPYGEHKGKYMMSDVEITDEETYSDRLLIRSHLGSVLRDGDVVLGYDLRVSVFNDKDEDVLRQREIPDVILVSKTSEHKRKKRGYHLKQLAPRDESDTGEFEAFLDELENDPDAREEVTIYKDPGVSEELPFEDAIEDAEPNKVFAYMQDI